MAVRIDAAAWRAKPGMESLLAALGASEGLTRYVGGAVRDDLLGQASSDVDLATRLDPQEVMSRLQAASIKAVPTGIEHGTVTAVSDHHPYEVTTLRRDVTTDGRRATVAFTDDWKEDAARRDFTINALSADPETGEVFDYFGGLADLDARKVRFIGEPLQRIAEDHLRILRFFRFHARFGQGEPDATALDACTLRANDLMALSRERIADELLKLLALPAPASTLRLMLERDILKPVLPEMRVERLGDLEALIANERAADIPPDPLRRFLALIPRDPGLADQLGARLKLSNQARKRLAAGSETDPCGSPQALAYRVGVVSAVDRLLLARQPRQAVEIRDWTPPRLPIGGGALIERGLTAGPLVAKTLRRIEDRWVEAGFPDGEPFEAIVSQVVGEASA